MYYERHKDEILTKYAAVYGPRRTETRRAVDTEISDEELALRMIQYFADKGWD